jgi:hypothetical protein
MLYYSRTDVWARVNQYIAMKGLRESGILPHMPNPLYVRSLRDHKHVALQKGLRSADELEQRVCMTFECLREGHLTGERIQSDVIHKPYRWPADCSTNPTTSDAQPHDSVTPAPPWP